MKSPCHSTDAPAQISFLPNTGRPVLHNFRLRDCPEWRLPIRVCACGGGIPFEISGGGPPRGGPPPPTTSPPPSPGHTQSPPQQPPANPGRRRDYRESAP